MFVLGAYTAPHLRADAQRERPDDVAARALLPEQPIRGRLVRIPGEEDCRVIAVLQEWVKCEDRPVWRNLYNGASYSILDTSREPGEAQHQEPRPGVAGQTR
jgi:hypothetical protein